LKDSCWIRNEKGKERVGCEEEGRKVSWGLWGWVRIGIGAEKERDRESIKGAVSEGRFSLKWDGELVGVLPLVWCFYVFFYKEVIRSFAYFFYTIGS
jgi:hypothetical protein